MSWDIFVQDFPREVRTPDEISADFIPVSLGKRSLLIQKMKGVVPAPDFSDPAWGRIDGDGWSIEVNMGDELECTSFAFHVRGGDSAVAVVAAILEHLNLRAVDSQTGGFFVAGPEAVESLHQWRSYRDQIVDEGKATNS